jgi:signal transduction histidine kinase
MGHSDFSNTTAADPELTAALSRADRWMATLAHELRDPLSAIIMSLDELHAMCELQPGARFIREIAKEGAIHMARVIDDVLELYRAPCEQLPGGSEPIELNRTVLAAVRNSHLVMIKRQHHLSISLPTDRLLLRAQPSRLQQIMTNLLINAAKYSRPGGEIDLTVAHAGGTLIISVRDNGAGIAPDRLSQIFELHRHGRANQSDGIDGLGIGLPLVRMLVELQGGSVSAHSEGPGQGSEFVVRLPNCIANSPGHLPVKLLGMTHSDDQSAISNPSTGEFEPGVMIDGTI